MKQKLKHFQLKMKDRIYLLNQLKLKKSLKSKLKKQDILGNK